MAGKPKRGNRGVRLDRPKPSQHSHEKVPRVPEAAALRRIGSLSSTSGRWPTVGIAVTAALFALASVLVFRVANPGAPRPLLPAERNQYFIRAVGDVHVRIAEV